MGYAIIPLSFVLTAFLIPIYARVGKDLGFIDIPDERKIHSRPIPRVGGFALLTALAASIPLHILLTGRHILTEVHPSLFAASVLMIALTGIYDDRKGATPFVKLLVQVTAGILAIKSGILIDRIMIPFDGGISLSFLAVPITLLWIVGLTNGYNLIDGLDGLMCLLSSFVLLTIGVAGFLLGNSGPALLSLTVAAALFAFFLYNRPPAKVFMGDAGSMTIGFLIATLSILTLKTRDASIAFFPMVLINGIVIIDTSLVFFLRILSGRSPLSPGLDHVHHRALRVMGNPKKALSLLVSTHAIIIVLGFSLLFKGAIHNTSLAALGTLITITALTERGKKISYHLLAIEDLKNALRKNSNRVKT